MEVYASSLTTQRLFALSSESVWKVRHILGRYYFLRSCIASMNNLRNKTELTTRGFQSCWSGTSVYLANINACNRWRHSRGLRLFSGRTVVMALIPEPSRDVFPPNQTVSI